MAVPLATLGPSVLGPRTETDTRGGRPWGHPQVPVQDGLPGTTLVSCEPGHAEKTLVTEVWARARKVRKAGVVVRQVMFYVFFFFVGGDGMLE